MHPHPPAPPPPPVPPVRVPRAVVVGGVLLTVGAAELGTLGVPRPRWTGTGGWLVEDVPSQIWTLTLGTTAACLALAVGLTRRRAALRWRDPAFLGWFLVLLAAAGALLWRAVYAAALSTIDFGAPIPVLDWAFSLVPALLAGWLTARRPRVTRIAAALGTGLVTVPLYALGAGLLIPRATWSDAVASLCMTAVFAAAPLAGGVALVARAAEPAGPR